LKRHKGVIQRNAISIVAIRLTPAERPWSWNWGQSGDIARRSSCLESKPWPCSLIRLHEKDPKIALATGSEYGVPLMVTGVVGQMMTAMKGMGNGDLDHSGLVKFVEELAKKELGGE
jgi:hypothetical protein